MNRPLYPSSDPVKGQQGHAGLWYEKYCNRWRVEVGNPISWTLKAKDRQTPKTDWVSTVVAGDHSMGIATTALLHEHHTRLSSLCRNGTFVEQVFQTTSRLVIGIGQNHPVENGFLWHPTLGVPYIPGSSIKGMLRNWMFAWNDSDANKSWFESGANKGVGDLIFLDALPLEIPRLEADVITPHYSLYYQNPERVPPADWHSPVPTPFLVVAAGAKFAIRVIQQRSKPGSSTDLSSLLQELTGAFDTLGIGAKTAVGYGRLAPTRDSKALAAAPPMVDPLEAFKLFCAGFGSIARGKPKQNQIIQKLESLAADQKPFALKFLRHDLKTKRNDCVPALEALLFPER